MLRNNTLQNYEQIFHEVLSAVGKIQCEAYDSAEMHLATAISLLYDTSIDYFFLDEEEVDLTGYLLTLQNMVK